MNILFITSSRIGDAVLSSGLLAYIEREYPKAKVTIACGPLAVSLFEGYPLLERIIPIKKQSYNRHWISLWRQTVLRRWDMVIDLRNSAVSRIIPARQRFIFGPRIDAQMHKVLQNAAVMRLSEAPAPKLWFTDEQTKKAAAFIPDGTPVIGIGPTANWIGKTWPAENFIALIRHIMDQRPEFKDARFAIFAAPGEEPAAQQVLASLPEGRGLDLIAKGNPGEAAAAISRCNLYIGNDSGLMHCAAAAGVPTFGLFGPSWPHIYGPWGEHTAYVSTPQNFKELTDFKGYDTKTCGCLMTTLTTDMAIQALDTFLDKSF